MKLVIYNKHNYSDDFIYNYIPEYLYSIIINSIDKKRIRNIDQSFGINSEDIIKDALKHLKITESANSAIIEVNKNRKYKGLNENSLINLITYGNRSCKGYNLIYTVFSLVAEKLDLLYKEWLNGNKILRRGSNK